MNTRLFTHRASTAWPTAAYDSLVGAVERDGVDGDGAVGIERGHLAQDEGGAGVGLAVRQQVHTLHLRVAERHLVDTTNKHLVRCYRLVDIYSQDLHAGIVQDKVKLLVQSTSRYHTCLGWKTPFGCKTEKHLGLLTIYIIMVAPITVNNCSHEHICFTSTWETKMCFCSLFLILSYCCKAQYY